MKNQFIVFMGFIFTLTVGCGGAVEETNTSPEPVAATPAAESQAPPPPPPPAQKPIQRTPQSGNNTKCNIHEEEDGTNMVVSDDHDWFLYVARSAQVDCGGFGGKVSIEDGPLTIKVKALLPSSGSDKQIETQLKEKAVGYIKDELRQKYGSDGGVTFKKARLGRSKRPALCADADLDMSGIPGRVVSCITSKKNVEDEIIIHRVVWVGKKEEYDPKTTVKLVHKASASWFRYSDTDGMGKIRRKW